MLLLRSGESLPAATQAELAEAIAKWDREGPANYDITVRTTGRRSATYVVEVRNGRAQSASLDGRPVTQSRLYSVWSVPGMFNTLQREFELEQAATQRMEGAPQQVRMYCRWNPTYGYPQSYFREAQGSNSIGWEVLDFISLPDRLQE